MESSKKKPAQSPDSLKREGNKKLAPGETWSELSRTDVKVMLGADVIMTESNVVRIRIAPKYTPAWWLEIESVRDNGQQSMLFRGAAGVKTGTPMKLDLPDEVDPTYLAARITKLVQRVETLEHIVSRKSVARVQGDDFTQMESEQTREGGVE